MKDLARSYPLLTPDERFRLFVQAQTRGDVAELDRLNNTCPQKNYRSEDYAYAKRKLHFLLLQGWQSQTLRRVEQCASLAMTVSLVAEDDEQEETARAAFFEAMGIRAARIEAWRRFCQQLGLPADTPVEIACDPTESSWIMGPFERLTEEKWTRGPDTAMVEKHQRDLYELWSSRIAD